MTIGQLCDAAVRYSDGTAANLLLDDIGGPTEFTAYVRSLGDAVSRLDQAEPELNRDAPGDLRDTATPRAVGTIYQRLLLGNALTTDKRAMLTDWMVRTTTGAKRIRAGFPSDWKVADKTGTGATGAPMTSRSHGLPPPCHTSSRSCPIARADTTPSRVMP